MEKFENALAKESYNDSLVQKIYEEADKNGIKYEATPHGDQCIIASDPLEELMLRSARGNWQREVVKNLAQVGWLVAYKATGVKLRGKAASYSGKYEQSLINLMERIDLPGRYIIESGRVGPKGGFGYWLDKY